MGSWQEEAQRLHVAESQAVLELAGLYGQALSEIGEETASIFSIHAMLLEDENFVETANRMLREEGVTAEYAVYQTGERIAAEFAAMDSHYMRARGADFRDISRPGSPDFGGRLAGAQAGRAGNSGLTRVFAQRGCDLQAAPRACGGVPARQCGQPHRYAAPGVSDPGNG